jgi:thiol:disulfide interchange protein DsbD
MNLKKISVGLLVVLLCAGFVQAGPKPKAKFLIKKNETFKVGKAFTIPLEVKIPAGWHAYQNPPTEDYQIPLSVTEYVKKGEKKKGILGKTKYPKGKVKIVTGEKAAVYSNTVTIPVAFKAIKYKGEHTIKIDLNYQFCDDQSCMPPSKLTITQKITVK